MVNTLPVYLPQSFTVTDDQFQGLARTNPELRLERTVEGELIAKYRPKPFTRMNKPHDVL
jgi:hypothetical protein